jgi:nitrogen-specific signal transduction histidine kinase
VTDNGPGISAENAPKLFTPFFSTKNQDRGLGLMLIADILRKHGADYSLATVNSLTTFTITLP